MAREFQRTDRVADALQRELAVLLRTAVKDPRIKKSTVSAVKVSRDLSHAKVYISLLDETEQEMCLKHLNNAAGFFRTELSKKMTLRVVPKLRFIYDESIERGNRLTKLIEDAVRRDNGSDPE